MSTDWTPLDYALHYARRGIAVLPLFHVVTGVDGIRRCSCLKGSDCDSTGKHPHTPRAAADGDTDEARIKAWWKENPGDNVGIATGQKSGLFVVDIDPRHGGYESWAQWCQANGVSENGTRSVKTGGGGLHLYYRYPEGGVKGRIGWLPGVDVKSNGGLVVAPPSGHVSGGSYDWCGESRLLDPPAALLAAINAGPASSSGDAARNLVEAIRNGDRISEGDRRNTVMRIAGRVRNALEDNEALTHIVMNGVNQLLCDPPMEQGELNHAVREVLRMPRERVVIPDWLPHTDQPVVLDSGDGDDGRGRLWINPTPDPPEKVFACSDKGNGDRLQYWFGSDIRYVPEWGRWLIYDGSYWRPDRTGKSIELAKAVTQLTAYEVNWLHGEGVPDEQVHELERWRLQSENMYRLKSMCEAASSNDALVVPAEKLDANPEVLNFQNGVVNLRDGKLIPHGKEQLCTKQVPFNYEPGADRTRWEQFLIDVMPDPEVRHWLKTAMGLTVTGYATRFFVVLYGEGGNGKSMFLRSLRYALGDDYCAEATNRFLTAPESTEVARMQGVRFVTSAELPAHKKLDKEHLKRITGEGKLTARFMRQDNFEYTPQLTLWVSTNNDPQHEHDRALEARMNIAKFEQTFDSDPKREKELYKALEEEAEGILAWCVEGAVEFLERGLWTPKAVEAANREHSESTNIVKQFADEHLKHTGLAVDRVPTHKVYDVFRLWLKHMGYEQLYPTPTAPVFGKQLRREVPSLPESRNAGGSEGRVYDGWVLEYDNSFFPQS